MKHVEEFADMGFPVLLGTSSESFIGYVLDNLHDDRDYGTGATTCLGIVKGAQIVRVHNVQLNVDMAKMMDAMLRGGVTVGYNHFKPYAILWISRIITRGKQTWSTVLCRSKVIFRSP